MPAPNLAAAAPAREVRVARQPVLDANLNLLGFELLIDSVAVLVEALSEIGLETLTGGHPAWLPPDRGMLLQAGPLPVESDRVVLQASVGDCTDADLIRGLRQLGGRGARIMIDGVHPGADLAPLLDVAWGVKLDLATHDADGVRAQLRALAGRDLLRVATSVHTQADFEMCRELGFTGFQGGFLAEPDVVPGRATPSHRLATLGSVAEIVESVEFEELEAAIARDVGMSHKLLRYANSALFMPSQRVDSVHQAMTILGARAVRRWATVLVMSGVRDAPHVLLVTGLVRARMCELLADDPRRRDRAFTVGLFSVINRLLGMPMREALDALPLSDDVMAALLRGEGPEGRSLRVALAWELGAFAVADQVPGGADRVARAYREALASADEVASTIAG
jgi:EAL and modified HD-GYP domain-containing signal transduction protein